MTRHWIPAWIRAHRNHPSLILWSADNENLNLWGAYPKFVSVAKFTRAHLFELEQAIQRADPTRPVTHDGDGDLDGLSAVFNIYYPEGYEKLPSGSIYGWASLVRPDKPTGSGEFLACPWVEAMKPDVFWWQGTWVRGMRYVNFTDIRPFTMHWAWKGGENGARENLKNSFAPMALFDKAYDDLGIAPRMKRDYPTLQAGAREQRTLVLYNDDYRGATLTAGVKIASGDKILAQGSRDYQLALGEHLDLPLAFDVPPAGGPLDLNLTVTKAGKVRFSETNRFQVTGEAAPRTASPVVELGAATVSATSPH